MRRVMLGGFVALALLAVACSDGDETGESDNEEESSGGGSIADEYVEAFQPGFAVLGVSEDESRCMAEAIVETVGTDRLGEVISPGDLEDSGAFDPALLQLDEAEAGELYDGLNECADFLELVLAQGGSPETVDCLRENVAPETIKALMVASFTGATEVDGEMQTELTNATATCSPGSPTPTTVPAP